MTSIIAPRDNAQRANRSRLLFKFIIAFSVAGLLNDMLFLSLPANYPVDAPFGFGLAVIFLRGCLILFKVPVQILTIVFFLQWFRRAYFNLHLIGRQPDHSDSWAVTSWFIPILNLFRPYSIMKEVWYDTRSSIEGASDSSTVLRWWWMAYLAHYVLGSVGTRLLLEANTMSELQSAASLGILSGLIDIVSAALTISVIGHVHRAEQHWQARVQLERLGGLAQDPRTLLPTEEEHYG